MFLFFGSSSLGTVTYRFARNDQPDLSVDPVSSANPYRVEHTSDTPQTIQIESWTSWDLSQTTPIEPKQAEASRLVGVELLPGYQPSFLSRYRQIPKELEQYGVNWLILTPTWKLIEEKDCLILS